MSLTVCVYSTISVRVKAEQSKKPYNNEEFKEQKLNGTHDSIYVPYFCVQKEGTGHFTWFVSSIQGNIIVKFLSKPTWKDRLAIVFFRANTALQTI